MLHWHIQSRFMQRSKGASRGDSREIQYDRDTDRPVKYSMMTDRPVKYSMIETQTDLLNTV